jgi:hypothetical protein
MRHDNGYDGYGFNDSICILECMFYTEGNIAYNEDLRIKFIVISN